ncbi:hypothetical protein DXU07_15830 [Bradyrhizobium elkanii]
MDRSPQGATERSPCIDNLADFTATLILPSVQIRTMKPFSSSTTHHDITASLTRTGLTTRTGKRPFHRSSQFELIGIEDC